ncbi:FAD-dependent oxidoreductase [Ornithinimicrobium flavum]|uniref:FAD-dependent oxidoreductase n=1 Tax=Ornithinimicrobium flavum TaxID=1288636 RepID=UPI0030844EB6
MPPRPTTYLVVGGGISGLAAAEEITRRDPAARVTLLEVADRVGGKLRGEPVAGRTLDVGAEAFLMRRPEASDLVGRAGLAGDLVHPSGAPAQVWSRGTVHPLPRRTLMGVPADPGSLRGLLTPAEVDRVRAELTPRLEAEDCDVASLVSDRLGAAVTERLVEPLLGGVYAGHARLLSARAALPSCSRWRAAGARCWRPSTPCSPRPTTARRPVRPPRSSGPCAAACTASRPPWSRSCATAASPSSPRPWSASCTRWTREATRW